MVEHNLNIYQMRQRKSVIFGLEHPLLQVLQLQPQNPSEINIFLNKGIHLIVVTYFGTIIILTLNLPKTVIPF